ncbi:MAG: CoA transferase [Dehalococcoidia bacterium]
MAKQALGGLKVADFTWVGAGPITTKYLADHGATVVRVESLVKSDPLRLSSPFRDGESGINRSGFYSNYNTGKYSVALNLNCPKGVETARRLVLWADVVAENFTPGVMNRWGLGYARVRELRPDIIYFSTSQQGQTGPHSHHAGYGNHSASLAGFTHITGWPDRDAVMPYGAYTDFISPRYGVATILAALDYRRRTGKGQHIDLSQLEVGLQFLAPLLMDCAVNGRRFLRRGNRDPNASPHGAYPCRGEDRPSMSSGDAWCVIAVFNDDQWRSLRQAMGDPPWASEPGYATLIGRKSHEGELDALIAEWTRQHTAEQVMERLQKVGVPAGVVRTSGDLFCDPQLRHRGHFVFLEHPEMGNHSYDGPSFKLSKTPGELRGPAPCLGEHTEFILRQFLGMDDEEIAGLAEAGALE